MIRSIPFGESSLVVRFPDRVELEWVEPDYGPGAADPAGLLGERLRNPMGARPLADLARGAKRVVVVIEDITRPTPSPAMLPPVLEELRGAGVETGGIRLLVGVGSHRIMTDAELEALAGREVCSRYEVLNHQARDPGHLILVGHSPRGIPVWINRLVAESDLCLLTGMVKPHNVAGYSGGYKGYFPAVAGLETIVGLHALQQLPGEPCRLGEMDNPFRAELEAMGPLVPATTFILNVIVNGRKQVVEAFAGDAIQAHRAAAAVTEKRATVRVSRPADVVLTCGAGYPSDISLYQGINALASVVRVKQPLVKPEGEVILAGEFREGLGAEFGGGRHKDLGTAWASHMRKMRRLTVVSPNVPAEALEKAGIGRADSAAEALEVCCRRFDRPHVIVMPQAPYTVGRAAPPA